ncbi:MAG: S-methyl-5-thioribose-1-phosphate isomerase [Bacteroidales bacterium]|nr:S-methyl-5-thioribose-1-phosphate isomerase [Bacteroidales bacterium]
MRVDNVKYQTIWLKDRGTVQVIDQRKLPFDFRIVDLKSTEDVYKAIKEMVVRGAPLIGVTASYGIYLALVNASAWDWKGQLKEAMERLKSARPTAINLEFALNQHKERLANIHSLEEARNEARKTAEELLEQEKENCRKIGENGLSLIEEIAKGKDSEPVNILTHCNAGWLATIDYGTATAPIYLAHDKGIKLHVWVDETRPRNQGARLTAWELEKHGIPYTVIADNTGGLLMQQGMVDMVITGSDRTAANGDVANKIGTYLKALAANDNDVPFYVAVPLSSIDMNIERGVNGIPIEQRHGDEVKYIYGYDKGNITTILLTPENARVANYGFDVTPAKYVTWLITEKGLCKPNKKEIKKLFRS